MRKAELECEPVDERLQRRARRAHGARHVDEAVAACVEKVRRADRGEDLACLVVGGKDRDGDGFGDRAGALSRERLKPALKPCVECGAYDGNAGRVGDQALRRVRREHRKLVPMIGRGLLQRRRDVLLGEDAGGERALEHAVARRVGGCRVPVGTARLGRLRQRDEQRRLCRRQPPRLLAKIGERRGANTLDVPAIGGERQVELEDLVLGKQFFQLQRHQHLMELAADVARVLLRQKPRHLHGDGGGAGDRPPLADELPCGTEERLHVDPVVLAEAPVLVGEERR